MLTFCILISLALCVSIIFNAFAYLDFKTYSKTALRSYRDTRKSFRVVTLLCKIFAIALALLIIVLVVLGKLNLTQIVALIALTLLFCLEGFVPYSYRFWCITEKGIFYPLKRIMISWDDFICLGVLPKKSETQLNIQIKKMKGESLKIVYYSVFLPADQAEEAQNIIHDFVALRDRQQYMNKQRKENKTPSNQRKFF